MSGSLEQRLWVLCVGTGARRMKEVQECGPVAKDWGPLTVGARDYGLVEVRTGSSYSTDPLPTSTES